MMYTWTKQFLVASAVFAVVIAGQTANLLVKEQRMVEKSLEDASKTVRVSTGTQEHLN